MEDVLSDRQILDILEHPPVDVAPTCQIEVNEPEWGPTRLHWELAVPPDPTPKVFLNAPPETLTTPFLLKDLSWERWRAEDVRCWRIFGPELAPAIRQMGEAFVEELPKLSWTWSMEHLAFIRAKWVALAALREMAGPQPSLWAWRFLVEECERSLPLVLYLACQSPEVVLKTSSRQMLRILERYLPERLNLLAQEYGLDDTTLQALLQPEFPKLKARSIPKSWATVPPPILHTGQALPPALAPLLLDFMVSVPPEHPLWHRLIGGFVPETVEAWIEGLVQQWTEHGSGTQYLYLCIAQAWTAPLKLCTWAIRHANSALRTERTRALQAPQALARHPGSLRRAALEVLALSAPEERLQAHAQYQLNLRLLCLKEPENVPLEEVIPSVDLTEVLATGSRCFSLGLGPTLELQLKDADQNVLTAFPKVRKTDDPEVFKRAYERWKQLKSDHQDALRLALQILERSLIRQNIWSPGIFQNVLLQHPLLKHLAPRLLWAQGGRHIPYCFRVAEDLSLSDEADRPLKLQEGPIGLVHPLMLSQAQRQHWLDLFSNYEIISPFPQLQRPFFEQPPHVDWYISPGAIMGLLRQGWHIGCLSEGLLTTLYKGNTRFCIEPGFSLQNVAQGDRQRIHDIKCLETGILQSEFYRELWEASGRPPLQKA